jgi:hypothetical protein
LNDAHANFDGAGFHACDFSLVPPRRPFAQHEATPATGERQQHTGTNKRESYSTLHSLENARSFFNEASTFVGGDSVKDKNSLPNLICT